MREIRKKKKEERRNVPGFRCFTASLVNGDRPTIYLFSAAITILIGLFKISRQI